MSKKKKSSDNLERNLSEEGLVQEENGISREASEPDIQKQDQNQIDLEERAEGREEDRIETLENSLKESKGKAEEYLDGWQRSIAEFANYKKRISREKAEYHQMAKGEVIKGYLEIVDDLERALQERPGKGDGATWAEGIEIIYKKFIAKLEAEGVNPMNALGEQFDPTIHEALMQEESEEHESGEIIEVLQEGYWIGEKVLRPALVRIAA